MGCEISNRKASEKKLKRGYQERESGRRRKDRRTDCDKGPLKENWNFGDRAKIKNPKRTQSVGAIHSSSEDPTRRWKKLWNYR